MAELYSWSHTFCMAETVDELHNQPNPAPTIQALLAKWKMDITIKLFIIYRIFRIYS